MSSSYSPILRSELIGAGDQAGTWGSTTNSNFQYIFEAAIAGYVAVTVSPTSNNQVLTYVNGPSASSALDQSVYAILKLNTGTLGANFNIFAPPVSKTYVVWNNTGYTATFYNSTVIGNTTPAGSGAVIPAGAKVVIWSDGLSFYGNDTAVGNFNVAGTLGVSGLSTLSGGLSSTTGTFSGAISGTTITGTNHIGPGTGLTGTAAALNIGGNAATASNSNALGGNGPSYYQTALGFTPVQQGGGSGMAGNKVYIGWSGSGLLAQVDSSPQGTLITSNTIGGQSVNYANSAGTANALNASNSYQVNRILVGNGSIGSPSIAFSSDGAQDTGLYWGGDGYINFTTNGAYAGQINPGGNLTMAGNVTAYSDERLKTDIQTFKNALDTVSALRGVSFIKDGKASIGVIAQEVQKILPQVVLENNDEMKTLSVAYGNIVGVLIEAIKELKAEIEELKRSK
jgi:Chaperone of endosialidase